MIDELDLAFEERADKGQTPPWRRVTQAEEAAAVARPPSRS